MATIKITQRAKVLANGEYPIFLRFTKDRKTKFISLKLSCDLSQWNETKSEFRKNYPNYKQMNSALTEIRNRAEKIISDHLGKGEDIALDEFEGLFLNFKGDKKISVKEFWDEYIDDLNKSGRTGNAKFYKFSKNSFFKFLENKNIYFKDITPTLLGKYEVYLRANNNIDTGVSAKMRAIRAIYNDAIRKGCASKEYYPFTEYKVSKLKGTSNKRALSIVDVHKVINLDMTEHPTLIDSRNYFVFSYYTRGMNFSDMMKLRWENIVDGKVIYVRSKTKARFIIKVLEPVQQILDYYKAQKRETKYVFPIVLKENSTPMELEYRKERTIKKYNKDLKEIASICKIDGKITSYVARHSFATNLKQSGVSTDIISEAMGHQNLSITQVYLKELENDVIDSAMETLLQKVTK
ncbi:site-specific integrase [Flavobacterium sp. MDT1-60]|uniref:site-specific integrase n=1 Tax=Flavobacterium sp. MDT1-60 TaxID=1979344 RepID=UPI001786F295|nr:site-specific integrase [Flavobacterium sp. MDT1-60]QOG03474.1 site-specific integrase [Flavobacterium sp. MDT1-60]